MNLLITLIALNNFLIYNEIQPSFYVYMSIQKTPNPLPMQTINVVSLNTPVIATNTLEELNRPTASITADPNPLITNSSALGQIILSWKSYGASRVAIRVDAPDGNVFVGSDPACSSKTTGLWARVGLTLDLQDV